MDFEVGFFLGWGGGGIGSMYSKKGVTNCVQNKYTGEGGGQIRPQNYVRTMYSFP